MCIMDQSSTYTKMTERYGLELGGGEVRLSLIDDMDMGAQMMGGANHPQKCCYHTLS